MKFFYLVDKEDKSICDKCGNVLLPASERLSIEGDTYKAAEYLIKEKEAIGKKLKDLGIDDNLIKHKGLTPGMLLTLGEKKIKNMGRQN